MPKSKSKTKYNVQEVLLKVFEDSSDSEKEYATDEEELFVRGIDPSIDK